MIWRVRLLGCVSLSRGSQVINHFESSRVAALLAHLALFYQHPRSREELIETLWPDEEPELGRHRFRQALYSLRRQLEPPGIPPSSVLTASRATVSLNRETVTCDVREFEHLVKRKEFREARALYGGELLPGFYDDWILTERYRLQDLFDALPENAPESPTVVSDLQPASPSLVSLPNYLTEYFGREDDRLEIHAQLAAHRMVTVTGLGGIGKTRIAVEVAREVATNFERTAFVPLEDCSVPNQILEHIPPALQLPASQSPPLDQLAHALGGSKVLLILDNLEQLAGMEATQQIMDMLNRLPAVCCIATSRRVLGIPGECEVSITPLPATLVGTTLEEAALSPGVALFRSRAQAGRPGFQITENTKDDIVALCNALDGLPLALEIAASRIRAFTPTEMLVELENRLRLLALPGRGAARNWRHRSIEATLEWSWRLLAPTQQQFLSALSVFRGGCTAEFAAIVCSAPDAAERLEELVMDSLVISEVNSERSTRFRLLELVRVFVRERLTEEQITDLTQLHQSAFLQLALRLQGGDQSVLLAEAENLKAALETSIDNGYANTALSLCSVVGETWLPLVGPVRAMELLQMALGLATHEKNLRVEALALASRLSLLTQNRTMACALASDALLTAGNDPAMRSLALVAYASAQMETSVQTTLVAKSLLEEAVPLAESICAEKTLGSAKRLLGIVATRQREYKRAMTLLASSLEHFETAGDRQGAMYVWDNLGGIAVEQNDLDKALELYGEARRRAEELNEFVYSAKVLQNLATIYARQKRWSEALAVGQECIRRNRSLGNAYILAFALWNITEPLTHLGQHSDAASLMAFIERFWVEQYDPLNEDEVGYCAMIHSHVVSAIGERLAADHRHAGRAMILDEAVRLALQALPD